MSKGKTESLPKNLTFEKALARLQDIVGELEDPDKGLEASLVLFEEGDRAVAFLPRAASTRSRSAWRSS